MALENSLSNKSERKIKVCLFAILGYIAEDVKG